MNSRERFINVVQGKPVDRKPFGAITSLYGARLTGCPLERFYNDAAAYAQGQDAVRELTGTDFVIGPFLLAGFGEAFGSTLHYTDRYVPNLRKPAITSSADISRLIIPNPDTHPRLLYMRESIRRLAATHGNEAVIIAILLNPLDMPAAIMGLDAWLETILTDESATRRMLDITTPFFVDLCAKLYADGARVLAMPMGFFTRDVTTRNLVTDFALPAMREALSRVDLPLVFHHTGSTFFEYLDLLDSLPSVAGFTMDIRDDLREARRRVRKERILFAGLDGPTLHTMSPEAIRAQTLELLETSRGDNRFVPFATGTDIDLNTPVDCLGAMRQAVEEFGNG